MSYRIPEIFLGVFLAVAIFAIGVIFGQERSAQATDLNGWTWLTKDAAGFFTFGLLIVGIGQALLFYFQLKAMRRSMGDSTKAAEAADLSAKAVTAIEFPVVRTGWMGPELMATDELILPEPKRAYGGSVNDGWPTRFSVIDKINFWNYGRTPAFAQCISFGVGVTNQLPKTPVYSTTIRCETGTVIKARGTDEIDVDFGFELTDEQLRAIQALESVFWFYGRLTFEDVMGRTHNTGFCWRWGRRQPEEDSISYFFDGGDAPAAYTAKT